MYYFICYSLFLIHGICQYILFFQINIFIYMSVSKNFETILHGSNTSLKYSICIYGGTVVE